MCDCSKFQLLSVLIIASLTGLSRSTDLIQLSCNFDSDCSSYQDKLVASSCIESNCKCVKKLSTSPVPCVPTQTIFNNKISECERSRCDIPNTHCNIVTKRCECNEGFIETTDNMRCITTTVPLNKSCEMNEQCVRFDKHAACVDQICSCLTNFTQHDNSCRSLVKVGERCESQAECHKFTTNVTCIDHKCACEKDFVSAKDGNLCLVRTYHGEDCVETEQCQGGLGPGSVCDNGKCVCDANHNKILDGSIVICQRVPLYGDSCKEHSDCSHYIGETTMTCHQFRCRCREGYELFDSEQKKCVATSGGFILSPSIILISLAVVAVVNRELL